MRRWIAMVGVLVCGVTASSPVYGSGAAQRPLRRTHLPDRCAAAMVRTPTDESAVLEIVLADGITVRYEALIAPEDEQPTWESVAVFDGARSYTGFAPHDAATRRILAFVFDTSVQADFGTAKFLGEEVELVVADRCYFRSDIRAASTLPLMVWGHSAFYAGKEYSYEVLDGFKAMPRVLRVYHDCHAAARALDLLQHNSASASADGRLISAWTALHEVLTYDCEELGRVYEVFDGFIGVSTESWCLGALRGRTAAAPPQALDAHLRIPTLDPALHHALTRIVRPILPAELTARALRCAR